MGYDIDYRWALRIPLEYKDRADSILRDGYNNLKDDLMCNWIPGLITMDDHLEFSLFDSHRDMVDEDTMRLGTCIFNSDTYRTEYSHNIVVTHEILRYYMDKLKSVHIPCTGYVFVSWDGVEFWYDLYYNSEFKGQFDIFKTGEHLVKMVKKGWIL